MQTADFSAVKEARVIALEQIKYYRRMMGLDKLAKYEVECYSGRKCIFTATVEALNPHEAKKMVNQMAIKAELHPVHFEVKEVKE